MVRVLIRERFGVANHKEVMIRAKYYAKNTIMAETALKVSLFGNIHFPAK